jgi:hypothetical protein
MFGDEEPKDSGGNGEDGFRGPEPRVHGKPGPKPGKLRESTMPEQPVGVSMEQIFQMIAKMSTDQQENMMKFAAELKKPSDREQKEIDAKEARIVANQKARIQMAQAEEDRKDNLMRGCAHATYHPGTGVTRHAWRAQVSTPGHGEKPFFQPMCQICHTVLPKIIATPDMLTQGVNLDQYMALNADTLKRWSEQMAAA